MKQLLTGTQMKQADTWSIQEFGMESLVLMERAALCVAQHIISMRKPGAAFLLCGMGNNGADGLAVARILVQNGWDVRVLAVGKCEKATREWLYQKKLLDKMNSEVSLFSSSLDKEDFNGTKFAGELFEQWKVDLSKQYPQADVYIDALFGIGLAREVTGVYRAAIEEWNTRRAECGAYGVAVDICSGVDAGSGQMLGACIQADVQITFGYGKVGQFVYPGAAVAKKTMICDIGFPKEAIHHIDGAPFEAFEQEDAVCLLGERCPWGNKGTFGRVIILAGSEGMAGAAYLSALAAYRTGVGLVEIITPECNRLILQQLLPEAVLCCIPEGADEETVKELVNGELSKAKAIVVGPGLSTDLLAKQLVDAVLDWNESVNKKIELEKRCPIVIDADALNLLAKKAEKQRKAGGEIVPLGFHVILTPHPGELGRLLGILTKEAAANLIACAEALQKQFGCICVCKDARTVIYTRRKHYLNLTGNSGMATGGSGDVLTGVIASLAAQGLPAQKAAVLGVWLHGAAGDEAAKEKSPYSMIARDLTDGLSKVLVLIETSRKKVEIDAYA
jgi:ADP-dependent NAD(P)H-hydrate dehydratase / NAD(P)H-hydrate epimerase